MIGQTSVDDIFLKRYFDSDIECIESILIFLDSAFFYLALSCDASDFRLVKIAGGRNFSCAFFLHELKKKK